MAKGSSYLRPDQILKDVLGNVRTSLFWQWVTALTVFIILTLAASNFLTQTVFSKQQKTITHSRNIHKRHKCAKHMKHKKGALRQAWHALLVLIYALFALFFLYKTSMQNWRLPRPTYKRLHALSRFISNFLCYLGVIIVPLTLFSFLPGALKSTLETLPSHKVTLFSLLSTIHTLLTLFTIPFYGLYTLVCIRLSLTLPALSHNHESPMKYSWELTRGHFWQILNGIFMLCTLTVVCFLLATVTFLTVSLSGLQLSNWLYDTVPLLAQIDFFLDKLAQGAATQTLIVFPVIGFTALSQLLVLIYLNRIYEILSDTKHT